MKPVKIHMEIIANLFRIPVEPESIVAAACTLYFFGQTLWLLLFLFVGLLIKAGDYVFSWEAGR